jgi:N4-gp56 family major capsid protein
MAYTDILSGASLGLNLVKGAYDRLIEFNLRTQPFWRTFADKKVADQSMPGDSVTFNLYNDLTAATTPLTETTDPTAVAVPSTSTVSVTLAEYGNTTLTTRKLRTFAFSDIDPALAQLVAFNLLDSVDQVIRDVLRAGTNVTREQAGAMTFNTGSAATIAATDTLKSRDVRASVTKLRARAAVPFDESMYALVIHPNQSYDLRSESGASAGWRPPHEYVNTGAIFAGLVGTYEGARIVESPRTYTATDGAASGIVYRGIMVGRQALAEVIAEEFGIRFGPVTDSLMRMRPVGWYGIGGWSRFREGAIQRIETQASI